MRDCFVIMPIGSGEAYQVHRNRYENIIQPAVEGVRVDDEQVFRCVRADFVTRTGSITRDLLGRLYRSDAVIADLTDLNPNVFYELGVRHALRSGTILIALKGTRPPFDVGDLRVIPYEDRIGGEKEAIPQIQDMLRSLLADERVQDSPVLQAIPELAELGAVKEHEARVAALLRERDLLRVQLDVSEKTTLTSQAAIEGMREAIEELSKRLSEPQLRDVQEEIESVAEAKRAAATPVEPTRLRDIPADPETVFVLMPMSKELEPVFDIIRQAADAVALRSFRADSLYTTGSIIDQIFESIAKSGLVVADMSGRNQNVMYELGLAHSMGKDTLLLSQRIEDLPFNIRHLRVLNYDLSDEGMEKLRDRLVEAFRDYRTKAGVYAELTVVFDWSDPACVQDRRDHPQHDFQLRLRARNTGTVALTEVRCRLTAGHDTYARIRYDDMAPYDRSRNGITLQPGASDYFDIAFCRFGEPQMVLQYADAYLLDEQIINQTPKATNTPVEVTFEARREDTNEPIPTVTRRYVVAPDGDAITLKSGGR